MQAHQKEEHQNHQNHQNQVLDQATLQSRETLTVLNQAQAVPQ